MKCPMANYDPDNHRSKNFKWLLLVLVSFAMSCSAFRTVMTVFNEMQKLPTTKESLKIAYAFGVVTLLTCVVAVFVIMTCYFLLFAKRKGNDGQPKRRMRREAGSGEAGS